MISLIEASMNTMVGFGISVAAGVYVYPLFGISLSVLEISGITTVFTAISIARGYIVRRLFVWAHSRGWR